MNRIKYIDIIIISVVSIFYYLLYFFGFWDFDFGDYQKQISNILNFGSLIDSQGFLIDRYPPTTSLLYGFLIRLLKNKFIAIFLIHLFISLLIWFLVVRIILINNIDCGIEKVNKIKIISVLVLFNPYVMSFVLRGVNSELLYILLSLISFYSFLLYINNKRIIFLFLFFFQLSLMFLTRLQAFSFFFAFYFILNNKLSFKLNIFKFIIPFCTMLLPILFWQFHIEKKSANPNFISSGGLNSFRDGLSFNHKSMRHKLDLPESVDSLSNEFNRIYYLRIISNNNQNEVKFILNKFMSQPMLMVKVYFFKFFRSLYGVDSQNNKIETFNLFFVFALAITFAYFRQKDKNMDNLNIFLLRFIIFYFLFLMLMSTLVLSIMRYQIVILPFVIIYLLSVYFKVKIIRF